MTRKKHEMQMVLYSYIADADKGNKETENNL